MAVISEDDPPGGGGGSPGRTLPSLPSVTWYHNSLFHPLICCPVQTCHSESEGQEQVMKEIISFVQAAASHKSISSLIKEMEEPAAQQSGLDSELNDSEHQTRQKWSFYKWKFWKWHHLYIMWHLKEGRAAEAHCNARFSSMIVCLTQV